MTSWIQAALGTAGARHRPRVSIQPLGWALGTLCVWQARSRERQALARLDDRLLADIGLTREQAQEESCKPFWRP